MKTHSVAVSQDYYKILTEEYKKAAPRWVTADWTHELKYDGAEVEDEGRPYYCEGFDYNKAGLPCDVCRDAEKSALYARNLARDAVDMAWSRLWDAAASLAEQAKDLESQYGDAVVWKDFYLTAVKARDAVAALKEKEDAEV